MSEQAIKPYKKHFDYSYTLGAFQHTKCFFKTRKVRGDYSSTYTDQKINETMPIANPL